jgi:Sulfotransferase family
MMGPDFVGLGAPRSGTSWLYEVLARHPRLWLPPVKELHYFDEPVKSKRYYSYLRMRLISGLWIRNPLSRFDLHYFFSRRSDEWYCNLFAPARHRGFLTGEITPAYSILDETVLEGLRGLNPQVRLIYIMRDPIMRSWSAVMKRWRNSGFAGLPSDKDALEYALSEGVRRRSSYFENIQRFEHVFRPEQIFYGFFEQLAQDPPGFAADVLRFLGVVPGDVTRLLPRAPVNVAAAGRMPSAQFTRALATSYLPWIEKLCLRFEGPPHLWHAQYEAVLNEPRQSELRG